MFINYFLLQERVGASGKATDALAGELWENKRERIRKTSKWSSSPDWDLRSVSGGFINSRPFAFSWYTVQMISFV